MCGIFGYVGGLAELGPLVLDGLRRLEYRGYDSWGIVVQSETGLTYEKQVGKIGQAEVSLPAGTVGLGHTRWATHGAVTRENAHPHLDSTGRLALIHNGIVENYAVLKAGLVERGHRFLSETDTEVIAHLIEEQLEQAGPDGDLTSATRAAFQQLRGLNAIVVIQAGSGCLVAAKNVSPLVLGLDGFETFIASDVTALLVHTNRVIYIEDGQIATIRPGQIELREVASNALIQPRIETISWAAADTTLNGFATYMAKEIAEQPQIVAAMAETHPAAAQSLADLIRSARGLYLVGCGTASYAALTGQYLLSRIARIPANFATGSEFKYLEHFLSAESLIIAFSQSGETADIIESVGMARRMGARIASLVNMPGSSLMRLSDLVVPLQAGPEQCVLSTKAYTAKVAALLLTTYALADRLEEGRRLLRQAARAMTAFLSGDGVKQVKEVARLIRDKEHLYAIGRGVNYPTALEAALKIKEGSYVHAEGFAGGELKHGVIALIETGTPCLVFAPNDETYDDTISGAMQLKARGGFVIGVASAPAPAFDFLIEVEDVGDAQPLLNALPAQLLGYHLALLRGHDPDKPRNLAKSVTVK